MAIWTCHYTAMLQNYVKAVLLQQNALSDIWMQDNSPPPSVVKSDRRFLEQHFSDCIILRNFIFPWSLQSPDLTPMHFWFWVHIKSKVNMCNLQTLSDLKVSIKGKIANIPHFILYSALLSAVFCIQSVIICDGQSFGKCLIWINVFFCLICIVISD